MQVVSVYYQVSPSTLYHTNHHQNDSIDNNQPNQPNQPNHSSTINYFNTKFQCSLNLLHNQLSRVISCSNYVRGVLAAALAAGIFAFIGVLVVLINEEEINSFQITFYRGIIQFLTTFIYDIFETKIKRNKQFKNNYQNISNHSNTNQKLIKSMAESSQSSMNTVNTQNTDSSDNLISSDHASQETNETLENHDSDQSPPSISITNNSAPIIKPRNYQSHSNSSSISRFTNNTDNSIISERRNSQFEETLDGAFGSNHTIINTTDITDDNSINDNTNHNINNINNAIDNIGNNENSIRINSMLNIATTDAINITQPRLRLIELVTLYSWSQTLKWTVGSCFFGGITICCYYYSLTLLSLGNAIGVYNIFPVFSFFTAYLILKEPIRKVQLLILIFAMIGVILIAQPTFIFGNLSSISSNSNSTNNSSNLPHSNESETQIMFGYGICLLGAVTQALSMILTRKLKNVGNGILLGTLYIHACALAIWGFIGSISLYGQGWNMNAKGNKDIITWIYLNLIGVLGFVAVLLLNYSLLKLPGGYASLIRSLDVVIGYILQIVILNDNSVNAFTILGVSSVMIPIGTYAVWQGYSGKGKGKGERGKNDKDCANINGNNKNNSNKCSAKSRESERILDDFEAI